MYIVKLINVRNLLSLTASEEVITFGADKLQTSLGSTKWRSTGLTPNIVGQFDESRTVQGWGPLYTNAQSGDQVRLRVANSQANLTASPLYDSTLVDVWSGTADLSDWLSTVGYVHSRLTVPTVDQIASTWFRIDFDYSGNSDGYVEAGALAADTIFQPDKGHAVGWQYLPETRASFSNVTAFGGMGKGQGNFKRNVGFLLHSLTEAELWGELDIILRTLTINFPSLVVLREVENDYPMNHIYYGYMDIRNQSTQDRFRAQVFITEP